MYRILLTIHLIGTSLVLLLISSLAAGQSPDYSFRRYTTDHGLSNDRTTCIFKDKQGFMWFGTVNGLNRFDGLEFTVYKRRTNGLPGNYIIGINQSPDGWLWISTHRGICRFNPLTEAFEQVPLPTQADERGDNDFVSGMLFDRKGYGWFASAEQLYRINLKTLQLTTYSGASQDEYPALMYLFSDSRDQLWVMRAGALYRFDKEKAAYTYIMGQDSGHQNSRLHIASLYEDSQQNLWATTFEKGLMRYHAQKHCFIDETEGDSFVNAMVEDWTREGKRFFWTGQEDKLVTYHPQSWQSVAYTHHANDAFSHNGGGVFAFFRDTQTGIIWMATSRGIQKADRYEIKFKRKLLPVHLEINPQMEVAVIRQDQANPDIYWLVLAGGKLVQWNRQANTYTPIGTKENLLNKAVFDVRQDTQGQLWIATSHGIFCWNPAQNHWKNWQDFSLTPEVNQEVTIVYPDKAGNIWAGSGQQGIFVLEPGASNFRLWPVGQPVSAGNSLRVHRFEEDSGRRIWVSTNQGIFRVQASLNRTEKITLQSFNKNIQPSDRLQSTIKIDSKGHFWVSGIGFLAKADLNGKVSATYTSENGLLADHIFSIEEDHSGILWLGTDYFLHRLNPNTHAFTYFRKENGLFANMSNQISKDASGELFIGFTGAFNHFVPEQLVYNQLPPPVILTGVKIDNKKRLPGIEQTISIEPSENTFAVDFAVLNYSLPEKNKYAYKLEGFDEEWTYTDNRSATYTNLSPGTYSFRVKAANSDGVWNEEGTTLTIHKIPHFYQTWWFSLLILGLVAGVIYAIYRYRELNRLRLEMVRNRIATDLHDDMGSTLSSIRIFSDVLQNQIAPLQPESVPVLQRISSSATELSESMQDIIWTIQTRHESLQDVVSRMREFGLKMAEAKQIDFRMQVSDKFHSTRFHVEQRRNVYLIFKESINNAVKYSHCTRLEVD
jgi:ligand-binding sensor domain-containing protein